jgi:hypothetical protein
MVLVVSKTLAMGEAIDVQLAPQRVVLSGDGVEMAQSIVGVAVNRVTGAVVVLEEATLPEVEATLPPPGDVRSLAVSLTGL